MSWLGKVLQKIKDDNKFMNMSYNETVLKDLLRIIPQKGKVDIRTLAKIMGCSVTYIEQHYDSARLENMTDYITRGVNEKSKDAFGDVILR